MLVNLKGEGQRGDLDTVLGGLEKAVADIPASASISARCRI
jgi:multidrug efflux pump